MGHFLDCLKSCFSHIVSNLVVSKVLFKMLHFKLELNFQIKTSTCKVQSYKAA